MQVSNTGSADKLEQEVLNFSSLIVIQSIAAILDDTGNINYKTIES